MNARRLLNRRSPMPPATPVVTPIRRCIVSSRIAAAETLVRFVVGPWGELVVDVAAALPGRGLWVSADRALIERACRRNLFAKAAGQSVKVPEDLLGQVQARLAERCLSTIGLACRAGEAVFGFDRCRARLAAGKVGAVLAARDGSLAERERLMGSQSGVPCVDLFDGEALGAAIGRPLVVHGLVDAGRLCDRLLCDAQRLAGILGPAANAQSSVVAAQPADVAATPAQ